MDVDSRLAIPETLAPAIEQTAGPARSRRPINPRLVVGGSIVALLILLGLLAPIVAPYDPLAPDPARSLAPPSPEHPLGNDEFGRDVLSRLIHGARISMTVSIVSIALALAVGTAAGLVSGFYGGL